MNQVATIPTRSRVEVYVDTVLTPDRLHGIARDLPSHIKPDLFKRNLLNAIMINPKLMDHEAGYVFREVSKAAGLGLYLDPALGEAYIVEAYDFRAKKVLPQLRIGYRGLTKLVRQSGAVSQVYAHEVRANDYIDCDQGTEKRLVHKPVLFSDRGAVVGYYAVALFTDHGFDFEPMSKEQTLAIRDRSDAYKAFKEGKIKSTPWSTDEDEMSKKTVIRRLAKRLPQSPELAEAIRIEDAAEFIDDDRTVPQLVRRRAPAPPSALRAIEGSAREIPQEASASVEAAQNDEAKRDPQEDKKEQPEQRRRAPAPTPSTAQPKQEPAKAAQASAYDPEDVRERFTKAAQAAEDLWALNDAYDRIVQIHDAVMLQPDKEDLIKIYEMRRAEIGED